MDPISVEGKVKHSDVGHSKRDIKGNGMEKKEMISEKITTCPEGILQNWNCLGIRGGENNATVNFIMERSPSDLDRLLKSGPSFWVCFGTDRLLQPAEGRQVWGGMRCLLPDGQECRRKSHGTFYWCIQVTEAIKSSPCFHKKRKEEQN